MMITIHSFTMEKDIPFKGLIERKSEDEGDDFEDEDPLVSDDIASLVHEATNLVVEPQVSNDKDGGEDEIPDKFHKLMKNAQEELYTECFSGRQQIAYRNGAKKFLGFAFKDTTLNSGAKLRFTMEKDIPFRLIERMSKDDGDDFEDEDPLVSDDIASLVHEATNLVVEPQVSNDKDGMLIKIHRFTIEKDIPFKGLIERMSEDEGDDFEDEDPLVSDDVASLVHEATNLVFEPQVFNDKDGGEDEIPDKFHKLMKNAQEEIYTECRTFSRLEFIVTLLQIKEVEAEASFKADNEDGSFHDEGEVKFNELKKLHEKEIQEKGIDSLSIDEAYMKVLCHCSGYACGLGKGHLVVVKDGKNGKEVLEAEIQKLRGDNTTVQAKLECYKLKIRERRRQPKKRRKL
ncbi:adenylate kinase [Bienertia sinuspersici]